MNPEEEAIEESPPESETQEEEKIKKLKPIMILDEEQKANLREAFNLLDYEGVGKIKSDDFRVAVKALGFEPSKAELYRMVTRVDTSGSGRLSFENFVTALMRKFAERDTDEEMMKSFRLMDEKNKGYLTFDDIKRVTDILEIQLSDEEIQEMVDEADRDMDEQISVQEFIKVMKRTVTLVTP